MTSETKNKDGPSCACGKFDLYEEWLKLNQSNEEKVSDSTYDDQDQNKDNSTGSTYILNQIPAETN